MTRVAARLLVDAIRRRTEAEGGAATVLARGDPDGGAILVVLVDRSGSEQVLERLPSVTGLKWDQVGPAADQHAYLERRRRVDPDLWIVELANLTDPLPLLARLTGVA